MCVYKNKVIFCRFNFHMYLFIYFKTADKLIKGICKYAEMQKMSTKILWYFDKKQYWIRLQAKVNKHVNITQIRQI